MVELKNDGEEKGGGGLPLRRKAARRSLVGERKGSPQYQIRRYN